MYWITTEEMLLINILWNIIEYKYSNTLTVLETLTNSDACTVNTLYFNTVYSTLQHQVQVPVLTLVCAQSITNIFIFHLG